MTAPRTITSLTGNETLAAEKTEIEIGYRWTVSGQLGKVTYDLLGNHLAYHPADGEIDSAGKRWAEQVQRHATANADDVVFDFLAWHYEAMRPAGGTTPNTLNTPPFRPEGHSPASRAAFAMIRRQGRIS